MRFSIKLTSYTVHSPCRPVVYSANKRLNSNTVAPYGFDSKSNVILYINASKRVCARAHTCTHTQTHTLTYFQNILRQICSRRHKHLLLLSRIHLNSDTQLQGLQLLRNHSGAVRTTKYNEVTS